MVFLNPPVFLAFVIDFFDDLNMMKIQSELSV